MSQPRGCMQSSSSQVGIVRARRSRRVCATLPGGTRLPRVAASMTSAVSIDGRWRRLCCCCCCSTERLLRGRSSLAKFCLPSARRARARASPLLLRCTVEKTERGACDVLTLLTSWWVSSSFCVFFKFGSSAVPPHFDRPGSCIVGPLVLQVDAALVSG